mgnify:CR=1 FL=1
MPNPRKPDPFKQCQKCGKTLQRKRFKWTLESMNAFLRRKYCDQVCMAAGMEGVIKVLNPKNSRRQSGKAIKRQCERCGKATKRHVHHKDENPLNNDPSNLETLCASCHQLSHSPNWDATTGQLKPCLHCSQPARRKGLCWTHLTRLKHYGDPLGKMGK